MKASASGGAAPAGSGRAHGFGAFRHRDFTLYFFFRILAALAVEMQATSIGWQVYRLTGRQIDLGLVGLAQFAPFALLFLVTGLVADRFSRVRILAVCVALETACAAGFFVIALSGHPTFGTILAVLLVFGVARAFQWPALQALLPLVVPKAAFANAVAWTSTGQQIARIAGPAVGGLLIAVGEATGIQEAAVYGPVTLLLLVAFFLTVAVRTRGQTLSREPLSLPTLIAGLRFIWTRQVIFAANALDLFAVLLGSAVALLPIYARDILEVGSAGFGLLRSAIMVGALAGAFVLTQRPIGGRAGIKFVIAVGLFGLGTIVFGLSETFWLSFAALAMLGAADAVSVFVRNNLIQLITPDDMRGRVGAVVSVFIGASNDLGEFRSGVTAHWWGTVPAVVVGGLATLVVTGVFAWAYPALRRVDSLDADRLIGAYRPPHDRRGLAGDRPTA